VAVTAKNRAEATPEFSIGRFLREVFDELRKVVWPTWGELYR
jgi:preprotein translocase subunit SecE